MLVKCSRTGLVFACFKSMRCSVESRTIVIMCSGDGTFSVISFFSFMSGNTIVLAFY